MAEGQGRGAALGCAMTPTVTVTAIARIARSGHDVLQVQMLSGAVQPLQVLLMKVVLDCVILFGVTPFCFVHFLFCYVVVLVLVVVLVAACAEGVPS